MKILIPVPSREGEGEAFNPHQKPWFPPTSAMTVAGMTSREHQVVIWDEGVRGPLNPEALIGVSVCAFGWLSTSRFGAIRVAKLCRKWGIPVIAGGMDLTGWFAEEGFEGPNAPGQYFDVIVTGPLTTKHWSEILKDFQGKKLQRVYNFSPDEVMEFVKMRYDLVNLEDYFIIPSESSRGCPLACEHCAVCQMTGKRKIHYKSPIIQWAELSYLKAHGVSVFADHCDSFGADYERTVNETLPMYAQSGMLFFTESPVPYLIGKGAGRAELVTPMRKAGCIAIYVGIESFKKRYGKNAIADVEEALKLCRKNGIFFIASIILDDNGDETWEDVRYTINWLKKRRIPYQLALKTPVPGSDLRVRTLQDGEIIDNNPRHWDGAWPCLKHLQDEQTRLDMLRWGYDQLSSYPNIANILIWLMVDPRIKHKRQILSIVWKGLKHIRRSKEYWTKRGGFKK